MDNLRKDRFIEKMLNIGLKEIFSQFYRKYDHRIVFEVWAEIMGNGIFNENFPKWRWTDKMTIREAVDSIEYSCDSIEVMIQRRGEEKERKRD